MTLYDKIQRMTIEQLAKFLCSISSDCGRCKARESCYPGHTGWETKLKEKGADT